jgi:hypothetical protein
MTDRRDNGPLQLPPERDVTPQLRARVLNEAMRGDRKPSRPPSRVGPILAGLAAAAVVVGIVHSFSSNGDGDGDTPATRQDTAGAPVEPHEAVEIVASAVPDDKIRPIQDRCNEATNVDARFRMSTNRLRSPLGRIDAGAYADKGSAAHTQIFCTPFAVLTSSPTDNLVTSSTPVKLIAGSRVQGLLPRLKDPEQQAYYDGAWFAVAQNVKQIEVRLVVDDEPRKWHSATCIQAYVFAATWVPLTADQLNTEIEVEYRAISVDDTLMPMPESVASSTVTPADAPPLNDHPTVFPRIGE